MTIKHCTSHPDLNTGVAFDSYDRFTETLSGKDTLHNAVGIIYQDIVRNENRMTVISPTAGNIENETRNQIVLDATDPRLPYLLKNVYLLKNQYRYNKRRNR